MSEQNINAQPEVFDGEQVTGEQQAGQNAPQTAASVPQVKSQSVVRKGEAKNLKREYNVGKHIASTSAKTLLICAFTIFVVILCVYVINPLAMANFCGDLGLKNAEVSCLELVYTRNKTDANLYNLILKLGNVDRPSKQNDYITKLQNSDSYAKFCESVDKSTLGAYSKGEINSRTLCYIYGTSEYLNSSYVNNLISQNKLDDAYSKAIEYWQAEQESLTDCTLYSYIQTLQTNKISAENRETYCKQLLEDESFEYLQTKYSKLEELDLSTASRGQIALYRYAKLKISYSLYMVYVNSGEEYLSLAETQKEVYTQDFVNWQTSIK